MSSEITKQEIADFKQAAQSPLTTIAQRATIKNGIHNASFNHEILNANTPTFFN